MVSHYRILMVSRGGIGCPPKKNKRPKNFFHPSHSYRAAPKLFSAGKSYRINAKSSYESWHFHLLDISKCDGVIISVANVRYENNAVNGVKIKPIQRKLSYYVRSSTKWRGTTHRRIPVQMRCEYRRIHRYGCADGLLQNSAKCCYSRAISITLNHERSRFSQKIYRWA